MKIYSWLREFIEDENITDEEVEDRLKIIGIQLGDSFCMDKLITPRVMEMRNKKREDKSLLIKKD